ncbi:MAG: signal peptidase I, partial [Firmicutes bacterium]|nr:signal peptidase I [Bacillota bacterium]
MNKAKKAGTVVISVLLWVIILIAALYSITVLANKDGNNVASVAGFTPLVVQSDSMAPTFCKDDMIIIRKCDTQKLEEGDIITFHTVIDNKLALNTHRIVKIEEYENGYRSFTTRGDNNPADDTHILAEGDIVGKHVTTIPKLGKLMNFLSSSAGFLIVIVIPMFIFFVYQLYHLITVVLALKKATALEALEEQA